MPRSYTRAGALAPAIDLDHHPYLVSTPGRVAGSRGAIHLTHRLTHDASSLDLVRLFENKPHANARPYADLDGELDAVRTRRKAMSKFIVGHDLRNDEAFAELVEKAFERGLALVLDPRPARSWAPARRDVDAFVLHLDQSWRALATRALWDSLDEAGQRWTDAHEVQEGMLLGYSPAERRAWLRQRRWGAVGAICTLLSREQRQRVRALGQHVSVRRTRSRA